MLDTEYPSCLRNGTSPKHYREKTPPRNGTNTPNGIKCNLSPMGLSSTKCKCDLQRDISPVKLRNDSESNGHTESEASEINGISDEV